MDVNCVLSSLEQRPTVAAQIQRGVKLLDTLLETIFGRHVGEQGAGRRWGRLEHKYKPRSTRAKGRVCRAADENTAQTSLGPSGKGPWPRAWPGERAAGAAPAWGEGPVSGGSKTRRAWKTAMHVYDTFRREGYLRTLQSSSHREPWFSNPFYRGILCAIKPISLRQTGHCVLRKADLSAAATQLEREPFHSPMAPMPSQPAPDSDCPLLPLRAPLFLGSHGSLRELLRVWHLSFQ